MIAADMLPRSELLPADTPARRLFSALPAERAADVLAFSSALRAFAAAPSVREKEAAAEAIRRAFPALRGLSLK